MNIFNHNSIFMDMYKKTYKNVTLNCVLWHGELTQTGSRGGVMSVCEDGFRFEEAMGKRPVERNPFIYVGKHCTLTHRKDGKYQINLRPIDATKVEDRKGLAYSVYSDIMDALEVID